VEAERKMLAAIRQIAALELVLSYSDREQCLTLSCGSPKALSRYATATDPAVEFTVAPLLLTEEPGAWRPLVDLASGGCRFDAVALDKVTAFVALRARSKEPALERTRLVLGRLDMSDADLDKRDEAVRSDIMATADPAAVLSALVRGFAHFRSTSPSAERGRGHGTKTLHQLLGDATLERLLQAVAVEPGLITEMRLLLGPAGGADLQKLCDDLEAVVHRVRAEFVP
jgi:hypothetical protein